MKKFSTLLLSLCLLLSLTACAGRENAADAVETTGDNAVQNNGMETGLERAEPEAGLEMESKAEPETELTMDMLLALYEDGALAEKVDREGLDGFLQYKNLKLADIRDESLTGLYLCSLAYSHIDSESGEREEREYEFQLYYWKPETAEEYGHKKNEIDDILLVEKETGDAAALYHSDSRYTTTDDLRGFLQKEYGIKQYLTVSLPEGYTLGGYVADMAYFSGWLLDGNVKEPVHGEWTPACWYAPGGVGRAENGLEVLQFEDGELKDVSFLMNHSAAISEVEMIENCEVSAALVEYEFDLFTASEWEEYLEENPGSNEEEAVSRYWYVFMGEEDSAVYYVLFLNEKLFSKEEAIETARLIHFAENAF